VGPTIRCLRFISDGVPRSVRDNSRLSLKKARNALYLCWVRTRITGLNTTRRLNPTDWWTSSLQAHSSGLKTIGEENGFT